MKKILFTLFALVLASGIAAQIPEPDFIGEVLAIHSDGTAEKLEKHNVKMRTGAGFEQSKISQINKIGNKS